MDRMDPEDPMDRIDPAEPIDRMLPTDSALRIDNTEPADSAEPAEERCATNRRDGVKDARPHCCRLRHCPALLADVGNNRAHGPSRHIPARSRPIRRPHAPASMW